MSDRIQRTAVDSAIHVLAAYIVEHLLRRNRKADLAEAELEIRDVLRTYLNECEKAGERGARRVLTQYRQEK